MYQRSTVIVIHMDINNINICTILLQSIQIDCAVSLEKKKVLKVLPLHTNRHCTRINLLYRLTEHMAMNSSLPFSAEHQQETITQTGIWITEIALSQVYDPLNNQEHVTLSCYKMFGILRNNTVLQPIVCDAMLKSQKQFNFYGLTNHQVTEQEEKRSKQVFPSTLLLQLSQRRYINHKKMCSSYH